MIFNKNYKNISIKKYLQIQEAQKINGQDGLEMTKKLIEIIYDIEDADALTITEFIEAGKSLKFLSEPVKPNKISEKYTLNGTTYEITRDISKITTAQFFDFDNYRKMENPSIIDLIKIFFIPKGKKYGEYDIEQVEKDLEELNIQEAIGILNFFAKLQGRFVEVSQHYLRKLVKKSAKKKEQKTIQALLVELNRMIKLM